MERTHPVSGHKTRLIISAQMPMHWTSPWPPCHEHRDFESRRHSFSFSSEGANRAHLPAISPSQNITQPQPRFHVGLILADVGSIFHSPQRPPTCRGLT